MSLTEYPFQKVLDSFPVNGQKPHKRKLISLDMHPWIMSLQRSLEAFVTAEVMHILPFHSSDCLVNNMFHLSVMCELAHVKYLC